MILILFIHNVKNGFDLEKGYHLFDVYGFALIKHYAPNAINFNNIKMKKIVNYALNISMINEQLRNDKTSTDNKYGYPYNSPAFEYPFIDYVFNKGNNSYYYNELFNYQIERYYDKNKKMFCNNTNDPFTLTARIYELCRFWEIGDTNE